MALFCRENLFPTQLKVHTPQVVTLWVRVSPHHSSRHIASIIYCVVYHSPHAPKEPLLDHLIYTSDALRTQYPCAKLVLCGDFNELDTKGVQDQLHLSQIVNFPTYGPSKLDLILTDITTNYHQPTPLPPIGRSPHLPVLWSQAPTSPTYQPSHIKTYRPLRDSSVR